MERTLNVKKDFGMFVDEMNCTTRGRRVTDAYTRGLITLEECIGELYRVEKEMLIEEGEREQARRAFYED